MKAVGMGSRHIVLFLVSFLVFIGEGQICTYAQLLDEPKTKEERLLDDIVELSNRGKESARIEAEFAIVELAKPRLSRRLVAHLKKGNPAHTQIALVEAIARIGDARLANALEFELKHGKPEVKRVVVAALGKIGDDRIVPTLFKYLTQTDFADDDLLRYRSAIALGDLGTKRARYSITAAKQRVAGRDTVMSNVLDWAMNKAEGKYDTPITDEELPEGRKVKLTFKGMEYMFYQPALRIDKTKRPWMLVCIHDTDFDYEKTFNFCLDIAKRQNLAVVVPIFDAVNFLEFQYLNYRGRRADTFLWQLLNFIGEKAELSTREVYMFGEGGGGDFVQRFALLYPERIAKALVRLSNPLILNDELYFPQGVKPSPYAPDMDFKLSEAVKAEMAVIVDPESLKNKRLDLSWEFIDGLRQYASQQEVLPRLAVRVLDSASIQSNEARRSNILPRDRAQEDVGDTVLEQAINTYMFDQP